MQIMDQCFYSPYSSFDEASQEAKAINKLLSSAIGSSLEDKFTILEKCGWKASKQRQRLLKNSLKWLNKQPPGTKSRIQMLLRHESEKSTSRNWCLWFDCVAVDKNKCSIQMRFWTRWNAAFEPSQLEEKHSG